MTIKAKRAKALPVLPENVDYAMGGMVDQTLPANAEAVLVDLASRYGANLSEWFRYQIGIYRQIIEAQLETPAIHEEIRITQEAQRALQEAMKRLDNMPPTADAYINAQAWKRTSRLFHSGILNDFLTIGDQIQSLLEATEQQLDELPKKGGRKSEQARNNLLSDTAEMLHKLSAKKLTKQMVAVEVVRLLSAANIDLPTDLAEVERLIRDSKKTGGNRP